MHRGFGYARKRLLGIFYKPWQSIFTCFAQSACDARTLQHKTTENRGFKLFQNEIRFVVHKITTVSIFTAFCIGKGAPDYEYVVNFSRLMWYTLLVLLSNLTSKVCLIDTPSFYEVIFFLSFATVYFPTNATENIRIIFYTLFSQNTHFRGEKYSLYLSIRNHYKIYETL